jgi:hypothetical protein
LLLGNQLVGMIGKNVATALCDFLGVTEFLGLGEEQQIVDCVLNFEDREC